MPAESRLAGEAPPDVSPPRATPTRKDATASLLDRLTTRADAIEKSGRNAEWDSGPDIALSVRARIELLRSGLLSGASPATVRDRAAQAAALVLSYEARGDVGESFARAAGAGLRGWGTSKRIKIGSVSADTAIDAHSTGTALNGLADLAEYDAQQGDKAAAKDLFEKIAPVADHWIDSRMFDIPGGGRSWEKIATTDPGIHRYIVFNTDAEIARSLIVLGSVARSVGDAARASKYEKIAGATARRIRDAVVLPVLDADGRPHPDKWMYALEVQSDGRVTPQRIEDSNHASFTLDFIALAVERNLGAPEGDPVFSKKQLAALGTVLPDAVFVKTPSGAPAYTVFIDPNDASEFGVRGKKKIASFVFSPEGDATTALASWWKQLAGSSRDLDMGLSIRTSWGWSESLQDRADVLAQVGQYLEAEASHGQGEKAANVFLSSATWLRAQHARAAHAR